VNVVARAVPLADDAVFDPPAWPCRCEEPNAETKGSNWGHLPDGRLVALDYAPPIYPDSAEPGPRRICFGAAERR
jgi:hypothetical protein